MIVVSVLLHVLTLAAWAFLVADGSPWAIAAGLVSTIAVSFAYGGRFRPWSDRLAWFASFTFMFFAPPQDLLLAVLLVPVLAGSLHVGPRGSPAPYVPRLLLAYVGIVVALFVAVWLPSRPRAGVIVEDAISASGIALGCLIAAVVIGLVAILVENGRARGARKDLRRDPDVPGDAA